MDIIELIHHPEHMDRDTLYELRSQVALYPYDQTLRLLMLQKGSVSQRICPCLFVADQ